VILSGTMQDGTIVPVQVDAQGRLVAEGLQGVMGPSGPPGPVGGNIAVTVSSSPPSGTANDGDLWIVV
jgi:hypothetical protein